MTSSAGFGPQAVVWSPLV